MVRVFLHYCHELPDLFDEIRKTELDLRFYGVSSPKIMSMEEAKYQKGTKIYSTDALNALIEKQDRLIAQYRYMDWFCRNVQSGLQALKPEDVQIVSERFEFGYQLREIADLHNSNKDTIQKRIRDALEKIF